MNALARTTQLMVILLLIASPVLITGCGSGVGGSLNWQVGPVSTIAPGGSGSASIRIIRRTIDTDEVTLRVTGMPAHMDVTLTPVTMVAPVTSSTLRVTTDPNIPEGVYTLHVFATESGQQEQSEDVDVTVLRAVPTGDFNLNLDITDHTFEGSEGTDKTIGYTITPGTGFTGRVDISLSALPSYLKLRGAIIPDHLDIHGAGEGGTFVLGIDTSAFGQNPYTLTVTATSGGIVHTKTIVIHFPI